MRVDRVAEIDRVGAHLDGERDFRDQVAGIGADDGGADHPVVLGVEEQLGDALAAGRSTGAGPTRPRGSTPLPILIPFAFASVSVTPAQATSGSV